MTYTLIKHLHISLALLSITGFALRGGLMLVESNYLNRPLLKRAPHLIDALLLASGVYLAWTLQQYPFVNSNWLTAKMIALVAYIGFGLLALKHGRSKTARGVAFVIASACALFMVATALQHSALLLG
jgi:uncharacterized membrane protein SirB2